MPLCRMTYPEAGAMEDVDEEEVLKRGNVLENGSAANAIEQLLHVTSGGLSQAIGNLSKVASNATQMGNFSDFGTLVGGGLDGGDEEESGGRWGLLNEIQLIKAVVLMVVVSLLLLSTCTIIFRTFSVFSGKKDDLQM